MDHTRTQCLKLFILKGIAQKIKSPDKVYNSTTFTNLASNADLTNLQLDKLEFTEGFTASELLEIFDFVEALKTEFQDDADLKFLMNVLSAFQYSLSLDQLMTLNVTIPALKAYFLQKTFKSETDPAKDLIAALNKMKELLKAEGLSLESDTPTALKRAKHSFSQKMHPDKNSDLPAAQKDDKEAKLKAFNEAYDIFINNLSSSSIQNDFAEFGVDYFFKYVAAYCKKTLTQLNVDINSKKDSSGKVSSADAADYHAKFRKLTYSSLDLLNLSDDMASKLSKTKLLLASRVNSEGLRVVLTYFRMSTYAGALMYMGWHGCALSFTSLCVIAPNVYRLHQYMRRSHFKHNMMDSIYDEGLYSPLMAPVTTVLSGLLLLSLLKSGIRSPLLIEPALISIYAIYTRVNYGPDFMGLSDFFRGGHDKSYLSAKTPACRLDDPFPYLRFWENPQKLIKPITKYALPLVSMLASSLSCLEMCGLDSSNMANILPYVSQNPVLAAATSLLCTAVPYLGCTKMSTGFHWFVAIGTQLALGGKVFNSVAQEIKSITEANSLLASYGRNYRYIPNKILFDDAGLLNPSAAPLSTKIVGVEIAIAALLIGAVYAFSKQYKKSDEVAKSVIAPQ